MSNDPFGRPSTDFFAAKAYDGKLVLFESIGQVEEKATKFNKPGELTKYVVADVTVIDAEGGPAVYPRSDVFGAALVGTLGRAVPGKPLLGRIAQGEAKAGQSAPWILQDYTDADAALAGQYLTQRASGSFQGSSGVGQQTTTTTPPAAPSVAAPAAAPQQSAVNLDDPAVQAALAALAAQGVAATPSTDEPPF